MDTKEREDFTNVIKKELEALREQLPSLEKRMEPVSPDASIGRLSRLDNMVNQGVVEKQLSNTRVRILKLEEALRRVQEDEDFGLCAECGDPIPLKRLLAMPEAELCVECAS
ncbi:TraR/DksA family transcriptional regulator [Salidesulfovibrio brasiliensis]|uniref:TraR/DksA family transcriptional regulator n=1 Tax=Salidesulfovibrio brasiliensis TaxID=221711 RepID=UPI0006D12D42|nr:TraR/DksA C4-type zinc finger protein [Salidesulfovibrio brasiliensis]